MNETDDPADNVILFRPRPSIEVFCELPSKIKDIAVWDDKLIALGEDGKVYIVYKDGTVEESME